MLVTEKIKLQKAGETNAFKVIVGETSFSVSHSAEEIETSNKHTGKYTTSVHGRMKSTISISGAANYSAKDFGYEDAVNAMKNGDVFDFECSSFEDNAKMEYGKLKIFSVEKESPDNAQSTLSLTCSIQEDTNFKTYTAPSN